MVVEVVICHGQLGLWLRWLMAEMARSRGGLWPTWLVIPAWLVAEMIMKLSSVHLPVVAPAGII